MEMKYTFYKYRAYYVAGLCGKWGRERLMNNVATFWLILWT